MPFTVDEFFHTFARYNEAIWPLQVFAYIGAVMSVAALIAPSVWQATIITNVLAAMWLINGIGYHWFFFSTVNPAARLFGIIFVAEAIALATSTYAFPNLSFKTGKDTVSLLALMLITFATIAYTIWGSRAGHVYPASPIFGVAPCPTTVFTIGMLLLGTWSAVRWLVVVPVAWSAVGGSAAILLNVPQDFGLIVAGFVALATATVRLTATKHADDVR